MTKEKSKKNNNESQKLQYVSKEEYDALLNRYQRVLADYENLSKRIELEKESIIKYSNENLLRSILVILDDLDESLKYKEDNGLNKIIDKFKLILSSQGVEQFGIIGDVFDPFLHEAIDSCEGESNIIVKIHQKGYKLNSKIIRPAIVSVGNGKV